MTKDEALKLALEALEAHADIGIKSDKAITAIKEALAQPEQEPVAWLTRDAVDGYWYATNTRKSGSDDKPLYTSPPQRQPLPAHEIVTMYDESPTSDGDMIAFARAIEKAHGIGDKP